MPEQPAAVVGRSPSVARRVPGTKPASVQGDTGTVEFPPEIEGPPAPAIAADGVGVPYYQRQNLQESSNHAPFIHTFYVPKAILHEGGGYHLKRLPDGKAAYQLALAVGEQKQYPPLTFDRRLTLNNWRTLLTKAMLLAGFRLAVLQANLQAMLAMLSNPVYEDVPDTYGFAWVGIFGLALVLWTVRGVTKAASYKDFIHPDSRLKRAITFASAALLLMFAVPNDIVLLPIHALPLEQGGLLCDAACIEGNWRWPVLTLAHSSKPDHDYTNTAGVGVQLPLFILVDVGCTILSVTIAVKFGILNTTALIQMCLSGLYGVWQMYLAYRRWELRDSLFFLWRKTAADPNMSESRQQAAMSKYIAEGGDRAILEHELAATGPSSRVISPRTPNGAAEKKKAARNSVEATSKSISKTRASFLVDNGHATSASKGSQSDLKVPWFQPGSEGQPKYRKFVHSFYVPKAPLSAGGYGPRMKDGRMEYHLDAAAFGKEYPPPTFDRRVTLNNWQETLMNAMLEGGFRNAGLQANIMMAVLMLESPDYENMSMGLWYTFVGLLFLGLAWWAAWGGRKALRNTAFVHPDSSWQRALTVMCSALLMMFAMPNDVVLFPIHLLPLSKGGLLAETDLVDNSNLWPAHTIAHFSKADHDFIDRNDGITQFPLFFLIDLGCTITNLVIALDLGVFNFTALLQMCTCGAYAFVKLREIFVRHLLRRKLLNLWLRTATDPSMSESRREAAKSKFLLIGGSSARLAEAARSAGITTSRLSVGTRDPH